MNRPGLFWRPYLYGDAAAIAARPDFVREHRSEGEPLFRYGGFLSALQYTVLRDHQPIACGGASWRQNRTYGLWGYAGDLAFREWAYVGRCIHKLLPVLAKFGAVEAQARVDDSSAEHINFLARLGFVAGGIEPDLDGGIFRVMTYDLRGL